MTDILKFDLPRNQSSIIKVIGVGGGGSNAVTHMYKQGIRGVDFIICNTDAQAMESSPVPTKIQIGKNLTSGLGAGSVPTVGRNAALENVDDIRAMLDTGTKMVFITAGMGGGTGTGAAPVIAQIAREMDILTVGIVTIPFAFEGNKRRQFATDGTSQMKQHVDALLIINNDKLRELYGDLRLMEAFKRADNILTTAAKGIAEIITVTGYINVDFEDVKTVMKNSGLAIMGTGIAGGENRAERAVEEALSSPLLDNNDIEGASNLLLNITNGRDEITMDEITDITNCIQRKTKQSAEVIWGTGFDESLEDKISVTIIATGFDQAHRKSEPAPNVIHELYPGRENILTKKPEPAPPAPPAPEPVAAAPQVQPEPVAVKSVQPIVAMQETLAEPEAIRPIQKLLIFDREPEPPVNTPEVKAIAPEPAPIKEPEPVVYEFQMQAEEAPEAYIPSPEPMQTPDPVPPPPLPEPEISPNDRLSSDRVSKLRALSERLKTHTPIEKNLQELENIPAYKRRKVELNHVAPSSESQVERYFLSESKDKSVEIKTDNPFLNKTVD